ncbi:type II toxin-antitoxin system ParD family antitoxin [Aminobacter carboxidus]|uniref:Type II toxin-antitoxin system ParD family antitoxin n=1 Tax=Aminobacter carboxidus TaxID=376165 RepID=A0ABR9GUQ1_9HYPH|nr:type II toxin-antitoxin system ParD family antitoxin [Aminobacter carboxidus]
MPAPSTSTGQRRARASLEALRQAIREGIESGAPEPFDFQSLMNELGCGSGKRGA